MINNPTYSKKKGNTYIQPNLKWHSNCEVIASCDIETDEEITVTYQKEVITKKDKKPDRVEQSNMCITHGNTKVITISIIN